jgi:hypothetical protein
VFSPVARDRPPDAAYRRFFKVTDRKIEGFSSNTGLEARPNLVGEVKGYALFRMTPSDVPALRKKPGPIPDGWRRVSPSLLRYADEQTIAGTAAVFTAIEVMGSHPGRFEGWGVVAASRYLGRANLAVALRSFMAEGVWGTSPHLIPHFALHSASGTISLALGLHGPNLGVGGGRHAASEGFLAALTWLAAGVVPGVWLVLSGWSPELVPDPGGTTPHAGECMGLALALVGAGIDAGRPVFRAVFGADGHRDGDLSGDLEWLAERLKDRGEPLARTIATDASGRLRIELVDGHDVWG